MKKILFIVLMIILQSLLVLPNNLEWINNGRVEVSSLLKYRDGLMILKDINQKIYFADLFYKDWSNKTFTTDFQSEFDTIIDINYNYKSKSYCVLGEKDKKLKYLSKNLYTNKLLVRIEDLSNFEKNVMKFSISDYGCYFVSQSDSTVIIYNSDDLKIVKKITKPDYYFPKCFDFGNYDDNFALYNDIKLYNFELIDSLKLIDSTEFDYGKIDRFKYELNFTQISNASSFFICHSIDSNCYFANNNNISKFYKVPKQRAISDDFDISSLGKLYFKNDSVINILDAYGYLKTYKNLFYTYFLLNSGYDFKEFFIESGNLNYRYTIMSDVIEYYTINKFNNLFYDQNSNQLLATNSNSILRINQNSGEVDSILYLGQFDFIDSDLIIAYVNKNEYELINPLTLEKLTNYKLKDNFTFFKINNKIYGINNDTLYCFLMDSVKKIMSFKYKYYAKNSKYILGKSHSNPNYILINLDNNNIEILDFENYTLLEKMSEDYLFLKKSDSIFTYNILTKEIKILKENISNIQAFEILNYNYLLQNNDDISVYSFSNNKNIIFKLENETLKLKTKPYSELYNNEKICFLKNKIFLLFTPNKYSEKAPDLGSEGMRHYIASNGNILCYYYDSNLLGIDYSFQKDYSIYPNPASDYIYVSHATLDAASIEIFNIFGEKIYNPSSLRDATPQDGNFKIDISNLPAGVYFIKIGDKIDKFIKI